MTRAELGRLGWMQEEVKELEARIHGLESACGMRMVSAANWTGKRAADPGKMGELVADLDLLRERLLQSKQRAMREYLRVMAYIDTIPDPLMRMVFRSRYLDGKSWTGVAYAVKGSSADALRMMHNRYLARKDGDSRRRDGVPWLPS